jgi:hypothetical protein
MILPYHPNLLPLFIVGVALLFLEMHIGSVYLSWRVRHVRSSRTAGERDQSHQ